MKKLRSSVMAKIAAWLLCIISVMGTLVLGLFLMFGLCEDMFELTREEALERQYKYANMAYSREAIWNRGSSNYARQLREDGFKYGIVERDSLEGVDFHDSSAYLDTNMTDKELLELDPDRLFLYLYLLGSDGTSRGIPMEYYGDYEDAARLDAISDDLVSSDLGWSYLYADRICFDTAEGIVYYRAEGHYYPVQTISLCHDGRDGRMVYTYSYDFQDQGYRLSGKAPARGSIWAEEAADEVLLSEAEPVDEVPQSEVRPAETLAAENAHDDNSAMTDAAEDNKIEAVLNGEGIVNFASLNDTAFGYSKWGTILLDNIRRIDGEELTVIDSGDIADKFFISTSGYYLNEDYTLVVQQDVQTDRYWVVSLVPDFILSNHMDTRYYQEGWFIDLYYDLVDMNLFQGLGISMVVMILSFGFLVYASGHRRGVDGIVLTPFDRIPLDLFSVLVCAAEFAIGVLIILLLDQTSVGRFAYPSIGICAFCGVIGVAIAILYLLGLCVRVKAGKWWRNTICYRLYSWLRDLVWNLFRHVGLLWKAVLVVGVVSAVELFVLAFDEWAIAFYLVERTVLCAALCVLAIQIRRLQKAGQCMAGGDLSYRIDTDKMFWECRKHGENLNKISEGMTKAVDARMKSERLKTELITNVSHDIKTPLTSIINYVDLLSKEELHNEKAAEYLEVLDRQSSKLKKLIEDLVEASKASSGNLAVDSQQLSADVFVTQTVGEFEEKLSAAGLELITSNLREPVYIMADGRHLWRVIDNLMNNICKYAQEGSRVYVSLEAPGQKVVITFRNISKYPLNISSEELTERFVRGDKSRNTEGHGLGLSIAQSLMKLIGGDMQIVVDGDLFKVILTFDRFYPSVQELDFEKGGDFAGKECADIDRKSHNLI